MKKIGTKMLSIHANEALKNLGERLRAFRLKKDETQKRFAARMGVSLPTYQKLESGSPSASIGLWINALDLLNRLQDVEQLLAEKESLFEQFATQETKSRKRASRVKRKRTVKNEKI